MAMPICCFILQGPTVESVGKDRSLMGQPENDEVDVALDAYINARQTLMSLQMEVGQHMHAHELAMQLTNRMDC